MFRYAGGSKEAFHSVYQAFETLADPDARKRYDNQLPTPKLPKQKRRHAKKDAKTTEAEHSRPQRKHSASQKSDNMQSAPSYSHDKLLVKLYRLLKGLPQEVRNMLIQKEFSQKQRVLLEKWIVLQRAADAETHETPVSEPASTGPLQASEPIFCKKSSASLTDTPCDVTSDGASKSLSLISAAPYPKTFRKKKKRVDMRGILSGRRTSEANRVYRANVSIDNIAIYTRECDLPTAVEFLVILTSFKQNMQGASQDADTTFETLFRDTLQSAFVEHGRQGVGINGQHAIRNLVPSNVL